jgi:thymidylate synthase
LAYLKNFFSPHRGEDAYTYGERIFNYQKSPVDLGVINQLDIMVKKLKSFPYNKGALITLWNASIDNFPVRKPWRTPCLTLIQGICQKERLHLTTYIRSNDMFGSWPQNAFALRKLQTELAKKISKEVGYLTVISQSAFIDETDLVEAERIVKENDRLFCQPDPRGNLIISVEGKEIVIKQMSPDGLFLAEFRQNGLEPKAALKMAEKLLKNQVISRVDHALDIGEQLGRAEDAIKLGLKFEQDKELKNK